MTRDAKLLKWITENPRASIPFRDFERLVLAFGFLQKRVTGSHRQYARPDVPYVVNIQPKGKDAKSYQVQQFLAMCAEHGLSLEE